MPEGPYNPGNSERRSGRISLDEGRDENAESTKAFKVRDGDIDSEGSRPPTTLLGPRLLPPLESVSVNNSGRVSLAAAMLSLIIRPARSCCF